MILVGDIGGTKTRLALYDSSLVRQDVAFFACRKYASLEAVIIDFLKTRHVSVQCACFGVPGPVMNGCSEATNLPWRLDERSIAAALGIHRVKLVNDLVATTNAVPFLKASELVVLHPGKSDADPHAVRAVLAPGTGLGQAYLTWDGMKYVPRPSEGGHVDFAPTSEIEIRLYRYLRAKKARVSYERFYSGPGLVTIFNFLKEKEFDSVPAELERRMQSQDPAAVISQSAMKEEFEICVKALDMFVSGLGAIAGNLVLTYLASGGVYLGGGIPPKILPKLRDGTIVKAYLNKGRLSNIVEDTSLYVIQDDHTALLGAAHIAAEV